MKKQVVTLTLALLAIGQASFSQNNFNHLPKKVQKELKDLKYVEGGTLQSYDLTANEPVPVSKKAAVSLSSFYISAYEVTNADWKAFQKAMAAKLGADEAKKFIPDTAAWSNSFPYSYNDPMTQNYYWHPAYNNYPVVGITWNQAKAYCDWKTDDINTKLKAEGNTSLAVNIHLPESYQWEYVAIAPAPTGRKTAKDQPGYIIPVTNQLLDKHGYTANFGPIEQENGYFFKSFIDDGAFHTAAVKSYKANKNGVFNILGNVEEWVNGTPTETQITTGYDKIMLTNTTKADATMHMAKGGSWCDGPYYLQPAASKTYPANTCSPITGFRIAMDIVEAQPAQGTK